MSGTGSSQLNQKIRALAETLKKKKYIMEMSDWYCQSFLSRYSDQEALSPAPGEDEHIAYWKDLGLPVNPVYYRIYSYYSQVYDARLVPRDIYFLIILKILNNYSNAAAFADKNLYHKLIPTEYLPKTFFMMINGSWYDKEYQPTEIRDKYLKTLAAEVDAILVKPSVRSFGGKNIHLLRSIGNGFSSDGKNYIRAEELRDMCGDNFIAQETAQQHPFTRQFNPSSLNTIRVSTYRSAADERIHILGAYFRIGGAGSVMDNVSSGGRVVPIDENGVLSRHAVTFGGSSPQKDETTRIQDAGITFPYYDKLTGRAKEIAGLFPWQRVLGLDLYLDPDGEVKFLEANNVRVGAFQFSGVPFFKDFTAEVRDHCLEYIRNRGLPPLRS